MYVADTMVRDHLASDQLQTVLDDCPPSEPATTSTIPVAARCRATCGYSSIWCGKWLRSAFSPCQIIERCSLVHRMITL